jgi:molecular chaperone GrpE
MPKKKYKKNKPLADSPLPNGLNPEGEATEEVEVLDAPETSHEALYKEALDRYQRTLAEFDNFRKRSIKEKAAQYDNGMCAAAEKLLPVVDNFERAMQSSEGTHANDTFYQGITLIARQFMQVLQDINVEEIPAKPGDDFNTAIHYAVAHAEDDNFGTNQVANVLQKGYMYKDKVLRYSMVKVAN